ncbi:MAG: hypothetical protein R3242_01450 [Akkermansiaceae bacterium]|nr:hypothetical protein [Akkermansiaceae bacterium]
MRTLTFWILTAFALPMAQGAPRTEQPRAERLALPNSEQGYAVVSVGEDVDLDSPSPLLFWFHGTGGNPNIGIAGARSNWIAVGMSYPRKEDRNSGADYGQQLWDLCTQVQAQLDKRGWKFSTRVVGGMSRGGWASFHVGATAKDGPDGIVIFAAGKDPGYPLPPVKRKQPSSVLIGAGETDPNYPHAQLACSFFNKAGAQVTYEEWLGHGHTYGASPRVLAWLDVQAAKRDETFSKACDQFLLDELAACKTDSFANYLRLRHLIRDPRFPHAQEKHRELVRSRGMSFSKNAELSQSIEELGFLQKLVAREAEFFDDRQFDVSLIADLQTRFTKLAKQSKDPGIRARAAYGALRAQKMHRIYSEQEKVYKSDAFQQKMHQLATLQEQYQQADPNTKPTLLAEIQKHRKEIADIKFKTSMGAFRNAEWINPDEVPNELKAAIEDDPKDSLRPYLGIGF